MVIGLTVVGATLWVLGIFVPDPVGLVQICVGALLLTAAWDQWRTRKKAADPE